MSEGKLNIEILTNTSNGLKTITIEGSRTIKEFVSNVVEMIL